MASHDERDEAVRKVVQAFVKAVAADDFEAYRRLHTDEVQRELDPKLFARNVARAERHRFKFRLKEIAYEGDVAEAVLDVIPGDGAERHRDELVLVLVRDDDGYKIVES